MKRFVTYLYECERGNKTKNTGFIRVNVRNDETVMEVYVRNYLRSKDIGKVYALINKKNLYGVEVGQIKILDGQGDARIAFMTNNIMGRGCSLQEMVGVGIRLDNAYIASCWIDEYQGEIIRGEFDVLEEIVFEVAGNEVERQKLSEKVNVEEETPLAVAEDLLTEQMLEKGSASVIYEKIDLSQIRNLPSPNWHLSNNSFLVHGFWNYGYLVLKKEMEKDKETLSLGVPGIFEKPEAVMAILFGFSEFEEIPTEMVEAGMNQQITVPQKEKNQEAMVGTFGCWFVSLRK